MDNLIYFFINKTVWPYSLTQLKLDNPNVSFSSSPSADDLRPYNVYFVNPTKQPEGYNERTEKVVEIMPVQNESGEWDQAWGIVDKSQEEVDLYDEQHKPLPNWETFKNATMSHSEMNRIIASAISIVPIAALALPSVLMKAENGDVTDFAGCWKAVINTSDKKDSVISELVELAEKCHLPGDFIEALRAGTIPQPAQDS